MFEERVCPSVEWTIAIDEIQSRCSVIISMFANFTFSLLVRRWSRRKCKTVLLKWIRTNSCFSCEFLRINLDNLCNRPQLPPGPAYLGQLVQGGIPILVHLLCCPPSQFGIITAFRYEIFLLLNQPMRPLKLASLISKISNDTQSSTMRQTTCLATYPTLISKPFILGKWGVIHFW